ncbi:hypothetical protein [Planctomycetes bacterium Poly30]
MNHDSNVDSPRSEADALSSSGGPSGSRALRWLGRIGIVLVLLLIAAVTIGPSLAGKWLRGEIERQAGERVNGRVTIDELKLSLNGKARLTGLALEDAAGNLVARVPEAKVDVGLRSLLTGKRDVSAVVTDAEIELVRDGEGTWNLDGLMIPSEESADEESDDGEGMSLPELDLHGRLEVVNATVTVRSPETVLTLREVTFGAGLDGNRRGLTIESSASVFGGEGSAGDFVLKTVIWPKAGDGATLSELSITSLDLGVVEEAMKLVGSPLEAGSVLEGVLTVKVSGSLGDLDPAGAFEVQATGQIENLKVDIRQGGLEALKFDDRLATLSANASRTAAGAEPKANVDLGGRDGKLSANVRWDGAADVGLVADVKVDGLNASAGLEPLLARVHPVFASAQAIDGAAVDALVSSTVHVTYDAPLTLETLKGGWEALPKEPLQGTGSLSVDEGLVETSPFFREVLQTFGQPANPTFDLKPLGFAVQQGRLNYTNPWTWTIQGTETRFAGSVGLGGDLDLKWVVPVTGGLARQNRVFEAIAGETFEVALGGTLTKPTFNLVGALSSLAKRAAKKELDQRLQEEKQKLQEKLRKELEDKAKGKVGEALEDVIGGDAGKVIDEVLGGKVPVKSLEEAAKGVIGSGITGAQGAADLLKSADALWKEGKKAEAAVLYKRIRDEFSISPTYLLNKKRIKDRQNG